MTSGLPGVLQMAVQEASPTMAVEAGEARNLALANYGTRGAIYIHTRSRLCRFILSSGGG